MAFRWFRLGFDSAVRYSLTPLFTTFLLQSALTLGFYPYLCGKSFSKTRSYGSELFKTIRVAYQYVVEQGTLTFTEICDLWERSCLGTNEPLPRKTFNNQKAVICKIFGLIIGCDRRTNRHYIENPEVLTEDKVLHWLFNMYSTMNQIQADQTLKERIMLEDVPSGQQWLILLT